MDNFNIEQRKGYAFKFDLSLYLDFSQYELKEKLKLFKDPMLDEEDDDKIKMPYIIDWILEIDQSSTFKERCRTASRRKKKRKSA